MVCKNDNDSEHVNKQVHVLIGNGVVKSKNNPQESKSERAETKRPCACLLQCPVWVNVNK